MKAKHLEELYMTMPLCGTFLENLVLFKNFLENIGHDKVKDYSINEIIYQIIVELKNKLDIHKVSHTFRNDDGEVFSMEYLLDTIERDSDLKFLNLTPDVRLTIGEPIFNINDISEENDFITSIKCISTSDGSETEIGLLGTKSEKGEMSELDTFLSFIDFETYSKITDISCGEFRAPKIGVMNIGPSGDVTSVEKSTDYIGIINLILNEFILAEVNYEQYV